MNELIYYTEFDYSTLTDVDRSYRQFFNPQKQKMDTQFYNNVVIMADTETSKSEENSKIEIIKKDGSVEVKYEKVNNYVVAWSIALRDTVTHKNIAVLYGRKPTEFIDCLKRLQAAMHKNHVTTIYFHNLAYDWVFLRSFLIEANGIPDAQLNTNPHYPISITWNDKYLQIRDSLIVAQRGIEKWAEDMDVEHKKAVGSWDYDLIRNQDTPLNNDELDYIACDVLAGVECLDGLMTSLNKNVANMVYTATGIPREQVRKLAKENKFKDKFLRMVPNYKQYQKLLKCYHGGFTHANRHLVGWTIDEEVKCFDFASSYPFCMVAYKFPMTGFIPAADVTIDHIIKNSNDYAFMFKLKAKNCKLKKDTPMPALQFSKAINCINPILDNGRILECDYIEIYLTDPDLEVLVEQYNLTTDNTVIEECEVARKEYLPRWFTDFVYECFINKTKLKGGDPVAYALAKSIINSLYGMLVQQSVKDLMIEVYETGEYKVEPTINEETYDKYVKGKQNVLPYQWGVWVTAYAFRNLFKLGKCCETWVYSDTDSCYAINWNTNLVDNYNKECMKLLIANGYGPVRHNGRDYWLGVAEHDIKDDTYSEFRVMGAKRYCGRHKYDKKDLKITVAGVPKKKGVKCLKDDISNFKKGFVFDGLITGKKTHIYGFEEIHLDARGNECADYIDLVPCDYKLDEVEDINIEFEEFGMIDYLQEV